jgi:hypothetical protein
MAKGAVSSEGSSGENIQHYSHLRMRITGISNFRMVIHSMDYVKWKELVPIMVQVFNRIQPVRIVNFVEQRAALEFQHLGMDEYVKINRIVVYTKEIYTSHPGA